MSFVEQSVAAQQVESLEAVNSPNTHVRYGTKDQVNLSTLPDAFSSLSFGMACEGALLHPTPEQLQKSFEDGDAVVALDSQSTANAIGYVRLEPLLTARLREQLGVSEHCPIIMESGSMFVSPQGHHRGRGHLTNLCRTLLTTRQGEIDRGELLVIGTTKHLAVLRSIRGCNVGKFSPCHHLEFPHIAALTCICSGAMGQGFHLTTACPERIAAGMVDPTGDLNSFRQFGSKIPCTMFVSDRELAMRADLEIAAALRTPDPTQSVNQLRARLQALGFYPTPEQSRPIAVTVEGESRTELA